MGTNYCSFFNWTHNQIVLDSTLPVWTRSYYRTSVTNSSIPSNHWSTYDIVTDVLISPYTPALFPSPWLGLASMQLPLQSFSPSQLPSPLPTPLFSYHLSSPSLLRTNKVYSSSPTLSYFPSNLSPWKNSQHTITAPFSKMISNLPNPTLFDTLHANKIDNVTPTPTLPPLKILLFRKYMKMNNQTIPQNIIRLKSTSII